MSISFQNAFAKSLVGSTSYRQGQQTPAQKMQESRSDLAKKMRTSEITQETEPYKDENDRLLRKMQFSKTKAEAMGEFYGSMQTALRESGSRGVMAVKRVGNMMNTKEAFQESTVYHSKKEQDTFVSDQMEAFKQKRQEMQEQQKVLEQANEKKETKNTTESARSETEENALRSSANKITSTTGTSTTSNADAQKNAAKQYKANDAQSRNLVNDIFTGMI